MVKEDVVHICSGILVCHKKNKLMLFVVAWMQVGVIILNEVSQKEKDKYHMITLIFKTETNSQTWRIDLWFRGA